MKIAITGTRGIPNQYGGFEQLAEYLSVGLTEKGHEVWVYNPGFHSYPEAEYRGVNIVRKTFYSKLLGSGGNYLYDLVCLRDAIRRKADVILECGYASAAPWYPILSRKGVKLVTHMDGMERQREKWGKIVRALFMRAEKTAVRYSDALVCDHPEIAAYYERTYSIKPDIIAYGAEPVESWDQGILDDKALNPGEYYLLVARLEPENKIQMIIEGFLESDAKEPLLIVGRYDGGYGRSVYRKFAEVGRLKFLGGLFEKPGLDNLRHFSKAVFHGHSVGGTNPSLLETMAAGARIIAHDNIYNRDVLGGNASYFSSAAEITALISEPGKLGQSDDTSIANNLKRIQTAFQWDKVVREYEDLFLRLCGEKLESQELPED